MWRGRGFIGSREGAEPVGTAMVWDTPAPRALETTPRRGPRSASILRAVAAGFRRKRRGPGPGVSRNETERGGTFVPAVSGVMAIYETGDTDVP